MKICTTCGFENGIEADICSQCHTPLFARAVGVIDVPDTNPQHIPAVSNTPPDELLAAVAAVDEASASALKDADAAAPDPQAELSAHDDDSAEPSTTLMSMHDILATQNDPPSPAEDQHSPSRQPDSPDESVNIDLSSDAIQNAIHASVAFLDNEPAPEPTPAAKPDAPADLSLLSDETLTDPEPTPAAKPDAPADLSLLSDETLTDPEPTPAAKPDAPTDLSLLIDETLAEGSKRLVAIPEKAPTLDLDVEQVPSVLRNHSAPVENSAPKKQGRGLLFAFLFIFLLAAAAVGAYFVLPRFGVTLPF